MQLTFHLIPNAHLDPVWLWDWREGLNEGIITCRTVLDLMDEYPELTFTRGECAIYQHIEVTDPATFQRITSYVEAKRWEVVGGTVIQPDTNLPATEALVRQYVTGQNWFQSRFGHGVNVGWAADSFGHAEGLPEILNHAGIKYFAFTRPPHDVLPLSSPVFWWQGRSGCRVLALRPQVGWYGASREEMPARLDELLAIADNGGLRNVGVPFGLGNHGGGPVRQQLRQIGIWKHAHPHVKVVYSGFATFFAAVEAELGALPQDGLPVHTGEMNFVMRGCYSSAARLKYLYRRAEAALLATERSSSVIAAALNTRPSNLTEAWNGLLFNAFHDILPGSSLERALAEQVEWLGKVQHDVRQAAFRSLNQLAAAIDTTVRKPTGDMPCGISFLVWNPHPAAYRGLIELEGCLDYRPIVQYAGRPQEVPILLASPDGTPVYHQRVATEGEFGSSEAWRARLVAQADIPAFGWSVYEMAWNEAPIAAKPPEDTAQANAKGSITNTSYTVSAVTGDAGIQILRNGVPLLPGDGLSAVTIEDPFGSWGAMDEDPNKLRMNTVRHPWRITSVETLEHGPLRAALWVRLSGGSSWMEITLRLTAGRDAIDCDVRLFWAERAARLKLVLPGAVSAEYDVPGGRVARVGSLEVPGGRWAVVKGNGSDYGFASDTLYGFDVRDGQFRPTLIRGTRYASDTTMGPDEQPWQPATDLGEHRLKFLITGDTGKLVTLADQQAAPPMTLIAVPSPGSLPRTGSFAAIEPHNLELLAIKPAEDSQAWVVRVQEKHGRATEMVLHWAGRRYECGSVPPYTIAAYHVSASQNGWNVAPVSDHDIPA